MWPWSTAEPTVPEHLRPKHAFIPNDEDHQTIQEALECDYERGCIPLYKRLEEEQFDAVLEFLNTGYWPGAFFADSVSPPDQASTWVTRFERTDQNRVRWSQLPLHLAIMVQAPLPVIQRLVDLYPQATRCTDDQRMLPLHLALRHGSSDEVLACLLRKFPASVNVRGGKGEGRLPVEMALRGPKKVLGEILETFVEVSKLKATKSIQKIYTKDIEELQSELQEKESELEELKSSVISLTREKERIETELRSNMVSLTREKERVETELAMTCKQLAVSQQNCEKLSMSMLSGIEDGLCDEQTEVRRQIEALMAANLDMNHTDEEKKRKEEQLQELYERKLGLVQTESLLRKELEIHMQKLKLERTGSSSSPPGESQLAARELESRQDEQDAVTVALTSSVQEEEEVAVAAAGGRTHGAASPSKKKSAQGSSTIPAQLEIAARAAAAADKQSFVPSVVSNRSKKEKTQPHKSKNSMDADPSVETDNTSVSGLTSRRSDPTYLQKELGDKNAPSQKDMSRSLKTEVTQSRQDQDLAEQERQTSEKLDTESRRMTRRIPGNVSNRSSKNLFRRGRSGGLSSLANMAAADPPAE